MLAQLILSFPDSSPQAEKLAQELSISHIPIKLHIFPDEESLITLPTELAEHVIVFRSLNQPNNKLPELLLVSNALRQHGVKRISLIAPYLCYMRQDKENKPGEIISQKIIGKFLASLFNDVLTVDTHLHRIAELKEAIPATHAVNLLATNPIVEFLKQRVDNMMILGPDSESEQWVSEISNALGCEFAIANKVRKGDKSVEITFPEKDFENKNIIIVDDMASTGRTMGIAAEILKSKGAQSISALVTHALFMGDAKGFLIEKGITNIWSSDTISDETNSFETHQIIAEAFRQIT